MKHPRLARLAWSATFAALTACGGEASTHTSLACGSPPPVAIAELWLSYPGPGTTAVPRSIGNVIFAYAGDPFRSDTVMITSSAGSIQTGALSPASSPPPVPHATPANYTGSVSYLTVSIPTLAANTTYTVRYTYTDFADNPPTCQTRITQTLGTFSTE